MKTCEASTETLDGKVYTCVRPAGHPDRHEDKDGVEWRSPVCNSLKPGGRARCIRPLDHARPHGSRRLEWNR